MPLTLVTPPTLEPLTLAEATSHLRVDLNDDDDLITDLITAAREYAETVTRRALLTQTWDLKLDAFPASSGTPVRLPFPPLQSVTSIQYVDTNGDTQTWSSDDYIVDAPSGPQAVQGRITPAYQESYPTTRGIINAVTIRFVTG